MESRRYLQIVRRTDWFSRRSPVGNDFWRVNCLYRGLKNYYQMRHPSLADTFLPLSSTFASLSPSPLFKSLPMPRVAYYPKISCCKTNFYWPGNLGPFHKWTRVVSWFVPTPWRPSYTWHVPWKFPPNNLLNKYSAYPQDKWYEIKCIPFATFNFAITIVSSEFGGRKTKK